MTDAGKLLSVAEAQARILAELAALPAETVPLTQAQRRVLASDIDATLDLPPFPNSSMDGYAVRAEDVASASAETPTQLRVLADIPAGQTPTIQLVPETAARIMTGAPLPAGADTVVPVELTDDSRSFSGAPIPEQVRIFRPAPAGAYVRQPGEDVRRGECVLTAGTVLHPPALGVLAALGVVDVPVVRRPRVAVMASGDELVDVHEELGPGQIRNVNSYTLSALVTQYGGQPLDLGVARDTVESVAERLDAAAAQAADLIVTSAGVSMGATDAVRLALEQSGQLEFWRVNMRPGKPVGYGHYRSIPWLGLPGNPVSSIVTFEVFARPAILKLGGHPRLDRPTVTVRLTESVQSDGRETYLRALVERDEQTGEYQARSAGGQGSHMLRVLANANALVIIPAGETGISVGTKLPAWLLSDLA